MSALDSNPSGPEFNIRNRDAYPEATVWDWFKSLLRFDPIPIPDAIPDLKSEPALGFPQIEAPVRSERQEFRIEWSRFRLPLGLIVAFLAQGVLASSEGLAWVSALFFAAALSLVIQAQRSGDFQLELERGSANEVAPITIRVPFLGAGIIFSTMTFISSGNNILTWPLFMIWVAAALCTLLAFWQGEIKLRDQWAAVRAWFADPSFEIRGWTLILLAAFLVITFFRVYRLNEIPYEMWSDHAEKLLDVSDVLEGRASIFFPRNTGREMLQFYLAAATATLLGTGISFTTLKIGTVLAGLLTLPFVYLFAKEYGGRYLGLTAMVLTGLAYWPNVISRVGLRFPLFPLFVAPALFFLVRGLRTRSSNDLLLSGLALGIGLHGYSPIRVLPLVMLAGLGIYLLHRQSRGSRRYALSAAVLGSIIAMVISLPLLRIAVSIPEYFLMRMTSRIYDSGIEFSESPVLIFAKNIIDGLLAFNVDSGQIWVVSIPNRPLLDWMGGGLFVLGFGMVLFRYFKERNWQDLFLLVSIPLLMLPSTLAIVFPGENPAPNRMSGVLVPVFTLAAFPIAALPAWSVKLGNRTLRRWSGYALGLLLIGLFARNNFQLTAEYTIQFREKAWNTSEAGQVVRGFANSIGSYEHAHIIAFAHWLDTRLVGVQAGRPGTDFGIWPDAIAELPPTDEAQLFILNRDDQIGLNELRIRFPTGKVSQHQSAVADRDFLIYLVPPRSQEDS